METVVENTCDTRGDGKSQPRLPSEVAAMIEPPASAAARAWRYAFFTPEAFREAQRLNMEFRAYNRPWRAPTV